MPRPDLWKDHLLWRLPVLDDASFVESPGFDPPEPWIRALRAVGRDLRCLRYGADLDIERLVWDFLIGAENQVTVGWQGFRVCHGLKVDAPSASAAAWIADVAQSDLAGSFVQWPSRGRHLLNPRQHKGEPVWVDPHGDVPIGPIGELCAHAERWRS